MLAGGSDEDETFVGGVLDLVESLIENGYVGSGDREGGVGCGIVLSKSSE